MTDEFKQAVENSEGIVQAGKSLADAAIADTAKQSGRTPEEQLERMADHFAYMAVEMDERQKQLDDYELSGPTVPVKP